MKRNRERELQEIEHDMRHEPVKQGRPKAHGDYRIEDQGKRQKKDRKFNEARSEKRNFTMGKPGGNRDEEIN